MRKTHIRLFGAAGSVLAAGAIALSGIVAATAAPRAAGAGASGIEHFQFMTTSPTSGKATVIVQGVFTAGGVDIGTSPTTDTLRFPNGTIRLRHSPGTGTTSLNPHTCLLTVNLHGTQTLLGGTGKYAGITGHQTAQLHILAITARSHGRCTQNKPPVSFELLVRASGPVDLER
jgi:hypothetical protein